MFQMHNACGSNLGKLHILYTHVELQMLFLMLCAMYRNIVVLMNMMC